MISSIFLVMALQQQSQAPFVQSVTTGHAAVSAVRQHRVTAGDTLSTIAPAMGESWLQLYADNHSVIGANPNLIYVGEVLYAGPGTRIVTVHSSSAPVSHPWGKTWGVSYGYPNYCGDGDGDGWDVPCQRAPAHPSVQVHVQSLAQAPRGTVRHTATVTFDGGVLSAAQVGQLWLEAGGPAWAESHAESIAACESGFNPRAYNPSGATGLWQILGSVVPGDLTNPLVNAENAVSKFRASGDTFAQWVCR